MNSAFSSLAAIARPIRHTAPPTIAAFFTSTLTDGLKRTALSRFSTCWTQAQRIACRDVVHRREAWQLRGVYLDLRDAPGGYYRAQQQQNDTPH
jgi:hypothetical protein